MHFQLIDNVDQVSKEDWDAVNTNQDLFCQYRFLKALEQSRSVGNDTGWIPAHLVGYQEQVVQCILPLYEKTHSYGEYVFDFAWADAYHQHGKHYYPKLVNAIPYTPVTGRRILVRDPAREAECLSHAMTFLQQHVKTNNQSSVHTLFLEEPQSETLHGVDYLQRRSVQFQWFNRCYQNFDDFLDSFKSRKRKSVRKEREKVKHQGVEVRKHYGTSLTDEEMTFFYQCYCQTYLKRSGHSGYLTRAFFENLLVNMHENLLLVLAYKASQPIAGALYLYDDKQLCGRYWGSLEDIDGLHFECCYYQGIEFCIEHSIATFNPGTQGEHKILRGFEPIFCYSNHWLSAPEFHQAVARFLLQEKPGIEHYKHSAAQVLPYRQLTDE